MLEAAFFGQLLRSGLPITYANAPCAATFMLSWLGLERAFISPSTSQPARSIGSQDDDAANAFVPSPRVVRESSGGLQSQLQPPSGWVIDSRVAADLGELTGCPAGQRNAAQTECLAAVQEAAQRAGMPCQSNVLKTVNDGATSGVPFGCSYSRASQRAVYNSNPRGRSSNSHPLVCTEDGLKPVDIVLQSTQNILFSKFLCTGKTSEPGCRDGDRLIDLNKLRLPEGTRLLIYGASFVRELAQLVLAAHSADSSLQSWKRDPRVANVTCWCGYEPAECDACVDLGSWRLGRSSSLVMVTNFRELQTEDQMAELDTFVREGNFTHAWVGRVHSSGFWDRAVPAESLKASPWLTPFFTQRFPNGLQWVEEHWDGWTGFPFSTNGLGCRAGLPLPDARVGWNDGVGSADGAKESMAGAHQCLFVCDTSAIDDSCRQGPLVSVVSDLVAGLGTPLV